MNCGDDGGVRITLREIYDALVGVQANVGSMTEQMGQVLARVEDHEQRIRNTERWVLAVPVSAVVGILTAVVSIMAGR